jgi:sugar lactone lactonase YvrE
MNFRSIAIIALGLAPISFSITFFQKSALAIPSGYCIHGNVWTREDIGRVKATVLLQGDFDGDGKIDYFCKDIRQKDPNGKQALEWLILGNGNSPIVAQPNNWCTHKNSRLSVVRKGDRDKLLCSDINTSWLRSLPSARIDDAPAISRSDLGWTYLFTPDYLGQKVHIRVLSATTGTGALNNTTTDKAEIATPNCNPNSVVATQSTLYVACNKDIGNSDRILAYDISNVAQPTLSKTITLDDKQFSRLMALALDSGGNLWFSSYGMGDDVPAKIARISSSSLASASPQVDKALVNSPSEPVGIAFDPDGSLWVAGTYKGGIVVNISTADLNKTGLNIDANPRYCISKSISGCNPIASSFDAPEGIAVLNGTIWVSSNGGYRPGHKMTALQVSGGQLTVKQTVGSSPGNPFSCPGGLFADGKDLYINDQSFGLTSTACGNGDGKATVDGVIKYGGGNLSSAPTVFKNTTSRPGFGGIAVLKIQ